MRRMGFFIRKQLEFGERLLYVNSAGEYSLRERMGEGKAQV